MYELNFKSWACIILTGLFLVVGGVGSCMYIRPKFSRQFADEVSWQTVDPTAAAAASGEEDITEGGAGQGGNQGGELEG